MRPILVLVTAAALVAGVPATAPADEGRQAARPTVTARADATPLGQVGPPSPCGVTGPAAAVINTLGAGTPSYTAPFNGVVTRFSHQANNVAGRVQALVFADGSTAAQKTVVAFSPKVTVATNTLNSFAARVPMKAGQKLGIGFTVNGMGCAIAANFPGDTTWIRGSYDAETTPTFVAAGTLDDGVHTFRPNIGAVLEPDNDSDGYGDVTQDACPASAYTQAACPAPETTITKKPKRKVTRKKIKVKVAFASSIPGSTFQCRLDGHRKWKPCRSPYTRKLGPGTHRLQVRAVSAVGIPDRSPAKVKIRIVRA